MGPRGSQIQRLRNPPAYFLSLQEKYEADLKKEIKKLQRYRDQVTLQPCLDSLLCFSNSDSVLLPRADRSAQSVDEPRLICPQYP